MVLAQAVVGGKKMIDSPQLVSDILLVMFARKHEWSCLFCGRVAQIMMLSDMTKVQIPTLFRKWFAIIPFLRLISSGVISYLCRTLIRKLHKLTQ